MLRIKNGVRYGPKIITDGLVLHLDANNQKSYVKSSIINMSSWTTGSDGCTGYFQNGNTNENERIISTNPHGYSDVIWESRPSGNGNDDGGWNTTSFNVDYTKLYRFSVWVKRTSDTAGGTFYLGYGGCVNKFDNIQECNPYWHCGGTGDLVKNQWYLFVGHVFPSDYSGTTAHSDTGIWTIESGKIGNINGCNIGVDCKFIPGTTTAYHRTYHYYCNDATTRLQFYDPRVDLCDGSEPPISILLTKSPTTWYDLSGLKNHCTFSDSPISSNGYLIFNGTSNYGTILNNASLNFSVGQTLMIWMKHDFTTERRVIWDQAYGGYGTWTHETGDNISQFFGDAGSNNAPYVGLSSPTTPRNVWNCLATTRSITQHRWYLNGVGYTPNNHSYGELTYTSANIQIGLGYTGIYWQGNIAKVLAYNRSLSETEIYQNYNFFKNRFLN